ncbi:DUF134 domain-containing protein [Anaerosporobacter faecicola]|uniref:DUF134 domain-containing protein n=1 Tax=Anaerosporobacter faecicola TaxID=2718714 RepID=UPI00143ACA2B|nr:DUF134 domain-containing protein [Anaerosporobacter faecicola]
MARPTKLRKIECSPSIPYFVPSETGLDGVEQNVLLLEELEALRLKDLEGLEQAECAAQMEVSRPTFQRILLSAREKVADCLIHGKSIHIEGGNYTRNICPVRCEDCHKEWKESLENMQKIKEGAYGCPTCGSSKVACMKQCNGMLCHKQCGKHRGEGKTCGCIT